MIKTIDSTQYHVWSDALHGRELARTTESEWDRGAYVRWTIQTAWSAFENACTDALSASGLGMRFKERFDEAVAHKGLPPVDWGQGIWQQVLTVYGTRKTFTHVVPTISHATLLSSVEDAENAIAVLRNGIMAVLDLAGLPHPLWINDDEDRGWQGAGVSGVSAHATVIRAGADENNPDAVRITYVIRGEEHVSEIAPPETDHSPLLNRLLTSLNVPVDAVRAYRGTELLEERNPQLR